MTTTAAEAVSAIDHDEAMHLAQTEYERLLDLTDSLTDDDWSRPTECTGWHVQDVLGHLLGMLELLSDRQELGRQLTAAGERAARTGGLRLDALTALQVEEHAHLTPEELRRALHKAAPQALAARTSTTVEQRSARYESALPGEPPWTIGYLFDIIHTRDPWMHRIDISRATGRELLLTADHDGRLVGYVVAEWAQRHGQSYTLSLTGPAGGSYRSGTAGPELEVDAVEFCRILSGRDSRPGLLSVRVPF